MTYTAIRRSRGEKMRHQVCVIRLQFTRFQKQVAGFTFFFCMSSYRSYPVWGNRQIPRFTPLHFVTSRILNGEARDWWSTSAACLNVFLEQTLRQQVHVNKYGNFCSSCAFFKDKHQQANIIKWNASAQAVRLCFSFDFAEMFRPVPI